MFAEQLWMKVRSLVPFERRIDVRYEELVSDPVASLKRICAFIGIEYSDSMFDYTKRGPIRYPDPALAFKWKSKLSPREVQLIESRIGNMLAVRGYALSGLPRLELDAAERAVMGVRNWAGVARRRMHQLGPLLWVESVLARRAGWKRWGQSVQLRVNERINHRLKT